MKVLVYATYDEGAGETGVFTAWVERIGSGQWVYLDPSPHCDEYPVEVLKSPTHWMPLPESPK